MSRQLQGSWNTKVAGMRKLVNHPQKKSLAPFEPAACRPGSDTRKTQNKVVQTFAKPAARKAGRHDVRKYDQRPRIGTVHTRYVPPAKFASTSRLNETAMLFAADGTKLGECQVVGKISEAQGGARAHVRYRVQMNGRSMGLAHKVGNAMRLMGR